MVSHAANIFLLNYTKTSWLGVKSILFRLSNRLNRLYLFAYKIDITCSSHYVQNPNVCGCTAIYVENQ